MHWKKVLHATVTKRICFHLVVFVAFFAENEQGHVIKVRNSQPGRQIRETKAKFEISTKISGTNDAMAFCQSHFAHLIPDCLQEEFHIVTLDTKNKVIDSHQITVGTLDASLAHPRETFRRAIKAAASSIILAHNHPSGDPTPSREDIQVTERLTSQPP